MDESGEAQSDEHQALVDAVDRVVEVIAVDGALGVADPCEGAVERVAVPVDHEAEGCQPEEVDVLVHEHVARGDHQRSEEAYARQHVGGHPFRLVVCEPHQNLLLGGIEYGSLNSFSLLVFLHIVGLKHVSG